MLQGVHIRLFGDGGFQFIEQYLTRHKGSF